MSTSTLDEKRFRPAPSIQALLDNLRVRIRQYVWAEGVASSVAWLGFAFWISLAADWFFEPPVPIRVILLLAAAAGLLMIVVKLIVRRAFVPLSDGNMATVLERRFDKLGDSLLTTVVLSRHDPEQYGYNEEMFERTCNEATERIENLRIDDVFDFQPLRRAVLAAVLLMIAIMIFGIIAPKSMGIWACRTLGLSEELWPRLCKLEMPEGFVNGVRKVARGDDVEIAVRAVPVAEGKFTIPREVEIRYRDEGGARGRAMMDKVGVANPERDAFQEFCYTRRNVLAPIRLDVLGGDARLDNLRIEVVESPKIDRWMLDCEYPAYLGRSKRSLPVDVSAMSLPQGSHVTVHALANKPLARVQIDRVSDDTKAGPPMVLGSKQLSSDRLRFDYEISSLDKDSTLLVTLFDADGIKSRDAIHLSLIAVQDQPPQIAAQLDGIGSAITPKARIAIAGRSTDDYGIGKMWFEYNLEGQVPENAPLGETLEETSKPSEAPTERILDGQALEVEKLELKPGLKFQVSVKASDLCTLGKGQNVGSGEQWVLDVVTPEQLRALLEGRELVLRQRFESIIREMTETRDLLGKMKMSGEESDSTAEGKGGKMSKDDKKPSEEKKPSSGDEPGDEPGDESGNAGAPPTAERLLARVQNASTNCMKSTQETLGLAEAFEDIRKQLVNNRVDTEELKERLQAGIADPLKKIGGEMLPELERRLELLQNSLEEAKNQPELRDKAKAQADAILLAMQKVLDRMLELEDYNQLVELLRDVIKTQDQLRIQTEQRQKQKIRDLLKE